MKNCLKLTVQKISIYILSILGLTLDSGCDTISQPAKVQPAVAAFAKIPEPVLPVTDAATILNKPEVPVLCYHQVRYYKPSDSKTSRDYIVPVDAFSDQMKSLADSGYNTILPDQLHEYLIAGKILPDKPVLITFDDTRLDQFTTALPELNKYGFKAAFFIMTVSLGKAGYMSVEQVKQLSDAGHTVGSHTYDHKNVKTYTVDDWVEQVQKPSKQLQTITGKPVEYFAYPFGLWNKEAIAKLKDHDFKVVFQLSAKRDENDPLFSVRRIIVPGSWNGTTMLRRMKNSF